MKNKPAVYDTRFFVKFYDPISEEERTKLRAETTRRQKLTSSVVIHELYNETIAAEGRDTAKVKVAYIKQDFEIVPVDTEIAEVSAELRHKYHISMGDSMIAATALVLKAACVTDDEHIKRIREIETVWI